MTGNNSELVGKNGSTACASATKAVVHGNRILTPDGTAQECGLPAQQSPGTTVGPWPADATLIGWAREKLLM